MPRDAGGKKPSVESPAFRVGIGYDSHRFVEGRPLILGGVRIPSEVGLQAHSDGDAICHAITDALLGAAGLGDIGAMFPDHDAANANRDSIEMLALAVERVTEAGLTPSNADVSVITEAPRLSRYRGEIRDRLAAALRIKPAEVSVKGKTNEGMGWIGRGEGLACIAVVTLRGMR